MNTIKNIFIILFVVSATVAVMPALAQTAPTQITNCAGLQNMQNNLSGNYVLTQNIDCNGIAFTPIGPNLSQPFTGIFDGQGYSIKGLNINLPMVLTSKNIGAGLFGAVGNPAIVRNVILDTPYVRGGDGTGALVGWLANPSNTGVTVSNVVVNNPDISGFYTGGLAGQSYGKIIDCAVNNENLHSVDEAGGLVGVLVGYALNGGIIETSASSGSITGGSAGTGGLVGYMGRAATIINSFSMANVTTTASGTDPYFGVGGLVGIIDDSTAPFFTGMPNYITNSYAAGKVVGTSIYTGGLVGKLMSPINFTGAPNPIGSYYDTQVTGQTTDAFTTDIGETTAAMQTSTIYQNTVWDLTHTWTITPGQGYPYLKWGNRLTPVSLSINLNNEGTSGIVIWSLPVGIQCPGVSCSADFSVGQQIVLTSAIGGKPEPVYEWGVSGCAKNSSTCTISAVDTNLIVNVLVRPDSTTQS